VSEQATELRYAIRLRTVLKYFGQLCLVLAALTLGAAPTMAADPARRLHHTADGVQPAFGEVGKDNGLTGFGVESSNLLA